MRCNNVSWSVNWIKLWLSSRLSAALAYVMLVNALAFTITGCVSFSDQLNMLFPLNGRGKISLVLLLKQNRAIKTKTHSGKQRTIAPHIKFKQTHSCSDEHYKYTCWIILPPKRPIDSETKLHREKLDNNNIWIVGLSPARPMKTDRAQNGADGGDAIRLIRRAWLSPVTNREGLRYSFHLHIH